MIKDILATHSAADIAELKAFFTKTTIREAINNRNVEVISLHHTQLIPGHEKLSLSMIECKIRKRAIEDGVEVDKSGMVNQYPTGWIHEELDEILSDYADRVCSKIKRVAIERK